MDEELKAWPLCFCGLNTTKNPHPDAGAPARLLEVGAVYECIPCMNKSRHEWSRRALDAEEELRNTSAQLPSQGGEAVAWREHSVNYAKGEKCPETVETLQAAWDRDQELINDMRHEIARHKTRINRLEQRRPAGQVAEGVRLDGLVRANLQMGRVYLHFKTTEQQHVALRELRALLAKSEGVKP